MAEFCFISWFDLIKFSRFQKHILIHQKSNYQVFTVLDFIHFRFRFWKAYFHKIYVYQWFLSQHKFLGSRISLHQLLSFSSLLLLNRLRSNCAILAIFKLIFVSNSVFFTDHKIASLDFFLIFDNILYGVHIGDVSSIEAIYCHHLLSWFGCQAFVSKPQEFSSHVIWRDFALRLAAARWR